MSLSDDRGRLARVLLLLNAAGAVIATAHATAGCCTTRSSVTDRSAPAWAAMSMVRTWSVTTPLLIGLSRHRPARELLTVAGLVQLGDAAIGVRRRNAGMAIAPALMGIVHLATAVRGSR